jgi:ribosomal-protein-alanine N-acetyltransferase
MNLKLLTERLALIPFAPTELELCLEMFTDPEVVKYAGGLMTRTAIEDEMDNWTKRGGDGCIGIWCITDRETGERFGSVALLPMPIEQDDTDFSLVISGKIPEGDIEIGYFLKRQAWGRGYATEAVKGLLRFIFQESPLKEVVATFEEENAASRNVLLKAGFIDHGTMRSYGEDGPIFRITRAEWSESQN